MVTIRPELRAETIRKIRKNRKIFGVLMVSFFILLNLMILLSKDKMAQPVVEKRYEAYCYPNRTVVIEVRGATPDYTRGAIEEIRKEYNIKKILDSTPYLPQPQRFQNVTIIATPKDKDKDPNSTLP